MNKKIIVVSVYNNNGGPLVLNKLCYLLNEHGVDAKLYLFKYPIISSRYSSFKTFINHLIVTLKAILYNKIPKLAGIFPSIFNVTSIFPNTKFKITNIFNKKNTIVIYPEIFYGNPLHAKNVVRWLLYYNRYVSDDKAYSKNDVFVAFRQIFNDINLNPENNILYIGHFNFDLYKQDNFGLRDGNCYILRKGRNRQDLPNSFDGPVFNNNMSDKEFVKILNKCKYCYSYDTQTFYSTIAAVCGCISIVVTEKGKSENDYLGKNDFHYGVAYGDTPEQIDYAMKTRDKLLNSLDFNEINKKNIENFIGIMQSKFKDI